MLLVDRDILSRGESLIEGFHKESVTNIGYDLTADGFWMADQEQKEVILQPGESVFVQAKENIKLPNDIVGRVVLRNSRIRQGFSLDAPIYQPGHHTSVFCRLTNVSADELVLRSGQQYAMILFEQLAAEPENPYRGAFSDESKFTGLASYEGQYRQQMKVIEKKAEDIKAMEKTIYANVLVILTVFVALFSFITTNLSLLSTNAGTETFLVHNFVLLGCISFLVGLLNGLVKEHCGHKQWILTAIFLLAAVVVWLI